MLSKPGNVPIPVIQQSVRRGIQSNCEKPNVKAQETYTEPKDLQGLVTSQRIGFRGEDATK
jgi:hypothetical protein